MGIPGTTTISSMIAPANAKSSMAVQSEQWNKGGYRSVKTVAERDALLKTKRWAPGMLVNILELNRIDKLVPNEGASFESLNVKDWHFEEGITGKVTEGTVGGSGVKGEPGAKGEKGDPGEQGPQGPKGEDGAGIEITGSVPTYADLPSGLTTEDDGKGYYVEADGKLYIWNGTSFPANGDGVQIQGPQGPQGVQGIQGPQGEQGIQGPAGADGADGISPTATVVRTQNGATITITDAQGTTTADVYDGSIANIPIASSEVLGAIKVGSNLSITADGILSADAQQVTLYSSTGQNTDGAMTQKATTDALALKADSSSLAAVAISGNYNDLSNKPIIPMIPTQTSAFANDGSDGTSVYVEADELAAVATSGSYNDLSNLPTIPDAQVNSDWNADSGVAQILNKPVLATVATSGSYTDLINLPTIPATNNINSQDWNALWQ